MQPTFEEVLNRMDRYIWHWAHKFGPSVVTMMTVDDLHQEGLIKLYSIYCGAEYSGKDLNELDAIFKASLLNMYKDIYSKAKREKSLFSHGEMELDIESVELGTDGFSATYLTYYLAHLSQFLSPRALALLEAFLHPTPAVYHLHHIQCMRRRAMQKQQGGSWRVPTKVTQTTVGHALGFEDWETKALVRELQAVWRQHPC